MPLRLGGLLSAYDLSKAGEGREGRGSPGFSAFKESAFLDLAVKMGQRLKQSNLPKVARARRGISLR